MKGYIATSRRREYVCDAVKINEAGDVADMCGELDNETQEHFYVFHLDGASRLIEKQLITVGTLNQSLVHPREVFRQAIINCAAAIIVVHNHPSGSLEPSTEDRRVTKRLKECGELIGIELLDHIIVSRTGHTSLREMGIV
jgi:DNA repair protein RadC